MQITKNELMNALEKIAPEGLAEDWDNGGIQIFTGKEQVNTILVTLDVNKDVVAEAVAKKADWIIAHHPLFFEPIKSINCESNAGRLAMLLISENICLYAAHTAFDSASGGNHEYLADMLNIGLEKAETILDVPPYIYVSKELNSPISLSLLCSKIKTCLKIENEIPYTGKAERPIRKIAICPGSGSSFIKTVKDCGCDAYITGDVKYHDMQKADQLDICVIDAGHYYTENTFLQNMKEKLETMLGDSVKIYASTVCKNPFEYFK